MEKIVVATSGCFSFIHAGHIELLYYMQDIASEYMFKEPFSPTEVAVFLNTDEYIRRVKGYNVFMPFEHRKKALELLGATVYEQKENNPIEMIKKILPHYWVKGSDYNITQTVEFPILNKIGTRVLTFNTAYPFHTKDLCNGF